MAERKDLDEWIVDALRCMGGRGRPIEVARFLWRQHQTQLRASGDLFYTWQQEMHAAAGRLRRRGLIKSPRHGLWAVDREAVIAHTEPRLPQTHPLALVSAEPDQVHDVIEGATGEDESSVA
jgi:hypothetical protein